MNIVLATITSRRSLATSRQIVRERPADRRPQGGTDCPDASDFWAQGEQSRTGSKMLVLLGKRFGSF